MDEAAWLVGGAVVAARVKSIAQGDELFDEIRQRLPAAIVSRSLRDGRTVRPRADGRRLIVESPMAAAKRDVEEVLRDPAIQALVQASRQPSNVIELSISMVVTTEAMLMRATIETERDKALVHARNQRRVRVLVLMLALIALVTMAALRLHR